MNEERWTNLRWACFGLLAAAAALAWANGLNGAFTYDDKVEVIGNPTIRTLESWATVVRYNASRPAVILTWALDWRLWGLEPLGYHVVNLLVHILNAGLVFALGEEIGRRLNLRRPMLVALAAAAIWTVHPMCTEAVTYVTGRSESLCSAFYLGSMVTWLRWRRAGGGFELALSLAAFLLAAATKEVAATLPAALLLLELCLPASRPMGWRGWLALLPFWLVFALGAVARKLLYGVFTTDLWLRPVGTQLATEAQVIVRYLQLWLLPVGQSVFHDHPAAEPASLGTILAVLLLLALLAGALLQLRTRPWLSFCAAFFLLMLLPSSSFVPLKETMAEHRAYLAGWAICFAAVMALRPLLAPRPRLAGALLGVLVLSLGTATYLRNRHWNTEIALWEDATRKNPQAAEAWYGLGDSLRFEQQFQRSIDAYRRAIELDDGFLDAWNNLGIALAEQGHGEEARQIWLQALRRHPSYCKAHNNLGWLHFLERDYQQAIAEFRTTLVYCPQDIQAHHALGNIYHGPQRDVARAIQHYQAVLDIDPNFSQAEVIKQRLLKLTF